MARTPAPDTRDRILDTASCLFYDHGVHATGQQQVIDACGCGKNLLYREFASKDDLVVAYLERCRRDWTCTTDESRRRLAGNPAGQLVAAVRTAADRVAAPGFRGCPFLKVQAEFPDPDHPAHRIAIEHRADVRAHLRDLAKGAGAREPDVLADRVLLIVDGVYANGAVLGGSGATTAAVAFAEEVVGAAIPAGPERA